MAQSKKALKPRKSPILKALSVVVLLGLLAVSTLMLTGSVKEILATARLNKELANAQEQLRTLETEKAKLSVEKSKLEDPAYVQNYARGTQLLSKTDEQVFILPKGE